MTHLSEIYLGIFSLFTKATINPNWGTPTPSSMPPPAHRGKPNPLPTCDPEEQKSFYRNTWAQSPLAERLSMFCSLSHSTGPWGMDDRLPSGRDAGKVCVPAGRMGFWPVCLPTEYCLFRSLKWYLNPALLLSFLSFVPQTFIEQLIYVTQQCLFMCMNLFWCDVVERAWTLKSEVCSFEFRKFCLPGANNCSSINFGISLAT